MASIGRVDGFDDLVGGFAGGFAGWIVVVAEDRENDGFAAMGGEISGEGVDFGECAGLGVELSFDGRFGEAAG